MTKTSIGVALGTFALAVGAFLSTNANKKFASATSAYYTISSAVVTLFKGASASVLNLTTVKISGKTAFVKTGTSANHRIFAVRSGTTLTKTVFVK